MGLMISRPSRCFASNIALAAARDCGEPTGKSAGHIGVGSDLFVGISLLGSIWPRALTALRGKARCWKACRQALLP
jgi:hypothetical protein